MLGGFNTFECGNGLVVIRMEADKRAFSKYTLSLGNLPFSPRLMNHFLFALVETKKAVLCKKCPACLNI